MVAVPSLIPVTTPLDTVAILGSLLIHETDLLLALDGVIVGTNVTLPPILIVALVLSRDTLYGSTIFLMTVTLAEAVFPLFVVAVMVVVPSLRAIINPALTVATLLLLLVQDMFLLVVLLGVIVAFIV